MQIKSWMIGEVVTDVWEFFTGLRFAARSWGFRQPWLNESVDDYAIALGTHILRSINR